MKNKGGPIKLWRTVPKPGRVTLAYLYTRQGSNDPKVLARWVARLKEPPRGCQAAVRFGEPHRNRWWQCRFRTAPGAMFCPTHGGPLTPPIIRPRKSDDSDFVRKDLQRRIELAQRRVDRETAKLKRIQAELARLTA